MQSSPNRCAWGASPPEMCRNAGDAIVQCTRFPLNRAFLAVVAMLMLVGAVADADAPASAW